MNPYRKARPASEQQITPAHRRGLAWFAQHRNHRWGHLFRDGSFLWVSAGKSNFRYDSSPPTRDEPERWEEFELLMESLVRQVTNEARVTAFYRLPGDTQCLPRCMEGDLKQGKIGSGFSPRKEAANDAGLSSRQAKSAVRMTNIDEANFDAQVEGDDPPEAP